MLRRKQKKKILMKNLAAAMMKIQNKRDSDCNKKRMKN